jgi:hypothetical protein
MAISLKQNMNSVFIRNAAKKAGWNYLFWLMLICLLAMEGLVIKNSIKQVLSSQNTPEVQKSKGVRINFKDYDEAVQRIEKGKNFTPSAEAGTDPFTGLRSQDGAGLLAVPPDETPTSAPSGAATTTAE